MKSDSQRRERLSGFLEPLGLWARREHRPKSGLHTSNNNRVGQFAVREGLKVIGSVGDQKKLNFITKELGFTSGFNYKEEKYSDAIKRLAPDGIDIYYDNVGGEALDVALMALKEHGRIGEYFRI
jgi:hypothetical protein